MSSMVKVLLDSTFLLPTIGVQVKEISERDLKSLAKFREKMEYYCLNQSLVEVVGKVAKNCKEEELLEIIELGLRSLLESNAYKWINPTADALIEAIELKVKGHRDIIDNMLYATAHKMEMYLLSIDKDLYEFLKDQGYDTSFILNVSELVKSLSQK